MSRCLVCRDVFLRIGYAIGQCTVNVTSENKNKNLYNANKYGVIRSEQAKAE